ncbi:MAG: acyl-ACP--UDP-N-acetylglucosamine O-acyltransferase [bacterium]|nr:acyl-ACP--UDP-N-acetylglucosamine O-acyltransferase [bacterium]
MPNSIHKSAIVDKSAIIGNNVTIGAYSIIEKGVEIKDGTEIGPFVRITGNTKIGLKCKIYESVSIGNPPQDVKFKGEQIYIEIGDNNILREYVTVHGGAGTPTIIGNNNFLMCYVHIAHNCKLGNNIIIANATQISGVVEIEDYAFVSGLCPVHQFTRIGGHSMIAGGYRVPKDVIPYSLAASDPLKIHGLNIVGLKRRNFPPKTLKTLKQAFQILLFSNLNTSQAIAQMKKELPLIPEVKHLLTFIETSKRGIVK